jgi:hypothetical protein
MSPNAKSGPKVTNAQWSPEVVARLRERGASDEQILEAFRSYLASEVPRVIPKTPDQRRPMDVEAVAAISRLLDATPEWHGFVDKVTAIDAAEETLSELGPRVEPMRLPHAAYQVYLLAQQYDDDILSAEFGEERVPSVRQIHARVAAMLARAEAEDRSIEFSDPLPDGATPAPLRPLKKRTRPADMALIRHLNHRAPQLGFAATTVLLKQEGTRGAKYDDLKNARALIVAEMCDDFGASLRQVGQLFDRQTRAVEVLRNRGRQLRQTKGENDG